MKINSFERKKAFSFHPIDRFSKFLCLSISICSQLSDYTQIFAIFTSSDVRILHLMAENSTISSQFVVHKIKKIDFSPNFEHGTFSFNHNLNPVDIPRPKIYAPNPDIFFFLNTSWHTMNTGLSRSWTLRGEGFQKDWYDTHKFTLLCNRGGIMIKKSIMEN